MYKVIWNYTPGQLMAVILTLSSWLVLLVLYICMSFQDSFTSCSYKMITQSNITRAICPYILMLDDSVNITKDYFVFHWGRIEQYGLLSRMNPIRKVTDYIYLTLTILPRKWTLPVPTSVVLLYPLESAIYVFPNHVYGLIQPCGLFIVIQKPHHANYVFLVSFDIRQLQNKCYAQDIASSGRANGNFSYIVLLTIPAVVWNSTPG